MTEEKRYVFLISTPVSARQVQMTRPVAKYFLLPALVWIPLKHTPPIEDRAITPQEFLASQVSSSNPSWSCTVLGNTRPYLTYWVTPILNQAAEHWWGQKKNNEVFPASRNTQVYFFQLFYSFFNIPWALDL
jgi:hypothetical protein